jgi:hypothetical protein
VHVQSAVASIQGDVAALRAERAVLAADRTALLRHLAAIRRRAYRLGRTLSAALPLPSDLVAGLQDGLMGFLEVSVGMWCGGGGIIHVAQDNLHHGSCRLPACVTPDGASCTLFLAGPICSIQSIHP